MLLISHWHGQINYAKRLVWVRCLTLPRRSSHHRPLVATSLPGARSAFAPARRRANRASSPIACPGGASSSAPFGSRMARLSCMVAMAKPKRATSCSSCDPHGVRQRAGRPARPRRRNQPTMRLSPSENGLDQRERFALGTGSTFRSQGFSRKIRLKARLRRI